MIIGTGIDLVVAIIFVENQPGIDIGDVASNIDFLGEDEDLREVVHGVVGFVSNIDVAINGEGAIDEHGESIHELLAGGVASGNKIAATIELIEIGGTIHGTETGVPLMIERGEAEIVFCGSFIRSETGDSIRRISDNSIAEAGLETSEDGGADAGDAGIARFVIVRNREWT